MKRRFFIFLFIFIFLTLFLLAQNEILQVSTYDYYSDKISKDLKIVQISDLHNKSFGYNQERLVKKINDINPDIIVMTGDIMDGNRTFSSEDLVPCINLIHRLSDRYPIYYITGNHEYGGNKKWGEFKKILEEEKVVILDEDVIPINDEINISGVHDNSFYKKQDLKQKILELSDSLDTNKLNIFLYHRPEMYKLYEKTNFDLILSGHAHGGQIRIPFILENGMYSPGEEFFPKYTRGVHDLGNNSLIISRGLGNSRFPIRFLNYPEIVVVNCTHLDF